MDFEFTEQQKMFQTAVRDFALREIAPLVDRAVEREEYPRELFPRMGDLGYICITYPKEYGGGEMGKTEDCIEWEETSRVSLDVISGVMVQSGVATSAIKDHGSEYLKQNYLVPAIRGRKIAAFGLTEPDAGSDVLAMQTTASKKGGSFVLNGCKTYITNGTICDFVTVAAYTDRTQKHRGVSLFVLDKGTPGFGSTKLHKFCLTAGDCAELVFSDCIVPEENLIGEEGKGFYYLMESLDSGRINHAAARIGDSQAAFEATLEYAKQRVQFGRPIAAFQANAFKLARMALDIEAARWMTYRAAWLFDQGRQCTKEASMAKLLASEVCQRVAIEAMQLHGGAAVLRESKINQHYKNSYAGRVTEGTSEIQELVIARQLGIPEVR